MYPISGEPQVGKKNEDEDDEDEEACEWGEA